MAAASASRSIWRIALILFSCCAERTRVSGSATSSSRSACRLCHSLSSSFTFSFAAFSTSAFFFSRTARVRKARWRPPSPPSPDQPAQAWPPTAPPGDGSRGAACCSCSVPLRCPGCSGTPGRTPALAVFGLLGAECCNASARAIATVCSSCLAHEPQPPLPPPLGGYVAVSHGQPLLVSSPPDRPRARATSLNKRRLVVVVVMVVVVVWSMCMTKISVDERQRMHLIGVAEQPGSQTPGVPATPSPRRQRTLRHRGLKNGHSRPCGRSAKNAAKCGEKWPSSDHPTILV